MLPSPVVCMWSREEVRGAGEHRGGDNTQLDVGMGGWEEEVGGVVWEEDRGGRGEACMPCDGLPQLRAAPHTERLCYDIIENSLPNPSLGCLPRRELE